MPGLHGLLWRRRRWQWRRCTLHGCDVRQCGRVWFGVRWVVWARAGCSSRCSELRHFSSRSGEKGRASATAECKCCQEHHTPSRERASETDTHTDTRKRPEGARRIPQACAPTCVKRIRVPSLHPTDILLHFPLLRTPRSLALLLRSHAHHPPSHRSKRNQHKKGRRVLNTRAAGAFGRTQRNKQGRIWVLSQPAASPQMQALHANRWFVLVWLADGRPSAVWRVLHAALTRAQLPARGTSPQLHVASCRPDPRAIPSSCRQQECRCASARVEPPRGARRQTPREGPASCSLKISIHCFKYTLNRVRTEFSPGHYSWCFDNEVGIAVRNQSLLGPHMAAPTSTRQQARLMCTAGSNNALLSVVI